VKGFRQKKGVNFEEIFLPGVKILSVLVILDMAACMNLKVK